VPTTWTDVDPFAYVASLPAKRQEDAVALIELFSEATGQAPRMFGPSIIGFGEYQYQYDSGHSGIAPAASFAMRSTGIVVYLPVADYQEALAKLGPHKKRVSCVDISKLSLIDQVVLKQIVADCYRRLTAGVWRERAHR
jgi:hypothetical protein